MSIQDARTLLATIDHRQLRTLRNVQAGVSVRRRDLSPLAWGGFITRDNALSAQAVEMLTALDEGSPQ